MHMYYFKGYYAFLQIFGLRTSSLMLLPALLLVLCIYYLNQHSSLAQTLDLTTTKSPVTNPVTNPVASKAASKLASEITSEILNKKIRKVASNAQRDPKRPDPEISTGLAYNKPAYGSDFMIVSSHPLATQAGYEILERGGHAVDAFITTQLVLGLVEPQSSGLGGGAFALYYDAQTQELTSYDARETAPNLAGPYLFYEQGKPLSFKKAVLGGRAVGVPGVPLLLSQLHEKYGALTWMELFERPIKLAQEGFSVTPRLEKMIKHSQKDLQLFEHSKNYFFKKEEGEAFEEGDRLKNAPYAQTLKDFAFYNSAYFYHGEMAERIIDAVQNAPGNPGLLTKEDFIAYKIIEREPVCGPYREYIICSMDEPSSGGLTLLQILALLERFDLKSKGPGTAQHEMAWKAIFEASRMAFTDRNAYMADPGFVNTPGRALLDPQYIQKRSQQIALKTPLFAADIQAGKPASWDGELYPSSQSRERPGTTHISIIDANGNTLSVTSTIEGAFGSHIMVGGFLLNNELTDFSFVPKDNEGNDIANRVEAGKRPRSSMAPTIVFNNSGDPILAIGSAGGSNIIGYVLQRIIAMLDWEMSLEEALAMPNKLAKSSKIYSEESFVLPEFSNKVSLRDLNSGLSAIHIKGNTYIGFADPRREGIGGGQ